MTLGEVTHFIKVGLNMDILTKLYHYNDELTNDDRCEIAEEIEKLRKAISEISIDHQEPKDYGWYSQCNGCDANLDKEQHEDDCPFVIAGVVTVRVTNK